MIYFLIYLIASWLLLLVIFRLSTHYKFYSHIVPFIAGYAVLAVYFLKFFGLQTYFWWFMVLTGLFLFLRLKIQLESKDAMNLFKEIQRMVSKELEGNEYKEAAEKELAPKRTMWTHLLSGTIVFILTSILMFYLIK